MHKMVDTTQTKIFVGGLPWETQRDTVQWYFEQFGEIIEAVVINDKITGRSKGYGFVTFKEPESAERACENPNPVIDGRRANCNLAVLGAQKTPPATAPQPQIGGLRPKLRAASSSRPFISTSAYFNHYNPQYALISYSNYAYHPFYQQNVMQNFNCNGYGSPGVYYSPYPCLYLLPSARGQSSYAARETPTTASESSSTHVW